MKPAFLINNRNKGRFVYRCVAGALAQTYPCDIYIADFSSTDNSREEIARAVKDAPRGAEHTVAVEYNDAPTKASMVEVNKAISFMVDRTQNEWIFQCSSDDYSLPDRVKVCMTQIEGLKNKGLDAAGIATTMRFESPGTPEDGAISGYPTESGYVSGGVGINRLAYGSTIWAYKKEFLKKVGLDVPCTLDVYLGFLASLDAGYYVVANPQHVHYMAVDNENIGFQGKMRAAEKAADRETIARINELNRFQLFELYLHCKMAQQKHYPMAHEEDVRALLNMMLSQAAGWYAERKNLMEQGWTPGTI